jgi:hypothetical protein
MTERAFGADDPETRGDAHAGEHGAEREDHGGMGDDGRHRGYLNHRA